MLVARIINYHLLHITAIHSKKMLSFSKVCKILADAVSMTSDRCPNYTIIPNKDIPKNGICDCYKIKRKVQENYQRWNDCNGSSVKLNSKGCCEIDNFTGNALFAVFYDIINMNIYGKFLFKPGDVIYFSNNCVYCAAIMFTKSKPVVSTPSPSACQNEENEKYTHLYSILFDDGKVQKYRSKPNKYQEYYSDNNVGDFRKEAKKKFPIFLSTKISDFDLFPFGYKFLLVLVPIAYGIGPRGNPRNLPVEHFNLDVPFAACLKFAFDNDLSGKITALCGEIGYKPENVPWIERVKSIEDAAEKLIKR